MAKFGGGGSLYRRRYSLTASSKVLDCRDLTFSKDIFASLVKIATGWECSRGGSNGLGSLGGRTWSDGFVEGLNEGSLNERVPKSTIERPTSEMTPRRSISRCIRILPSD